jgi:hypothetical protein
MSTKRKSKNRPKILLEWLLDRPFAIFFMTLFLLGIPAITATNIYLSEQNDNHKNTTSETKSDNTYTPAKEKTVNNTSTYTDATESLPDAPTNAPAGSDYSKTENCSKEVLTYTTTYQNDTYMYIGETTSRGGTDGYKITCTVVYSGADWGDYSGQTYQYTKDYVLPDDKVVYKGTKKQSSDPVSTGYTYEQALSAAKNKCQTIAQASGIDSSAYLVCIDAALATYGY